MGDFDLDLDLQTAEGELDEDEAGNERIVLAILDGTTPPREWVEAVEAGQVLVLSVDGDLNELAAGFARDVRDLGGELMHFREFLVVTPPGITIDRSRLD